MNPTLNVGRGGGGWQNLKNVSGGHNNVHIAIMFVYFTLFVRCSILCICFYIICCNMMYCIYSINTNQVNDRKFTTTMQK